MSAFVLGIPEHKVQVIGPDVGGGFGSKCFHYTEEALLTWASKKIARPIKWTSERSESFLLDAHGRDHITKAEMGFDNDGKFSTFRVKTSQIWSLPATFESGVPPFAGTLLQGVYITQINIPYRGFY